MKHLTQFELDALLDAAKAKNESDYLMFLVTFNHGLRVSETLSLTRENISGGHLVIQRLKGSKKTTQRLLPNERLALEELAKNEGLFFPMHRKTFWLKMKTYGVAAGLSEFKAHPHALKHTTAMLGLKGGMDINELQAYLGHKNGANTMEYLKVQDDVASDAFLKALGGK